MKRLLLLTACVFYSISAFSQEVQANDELWERVNTYVGKKLVATDPDLAKHRLVSLTAFPVYAYWTEPEGFFTLYMLADSVPNKSPLWLWNANKRFSFSYGLFLDSLDTSGSPASPAELAKRKHAEAAYNAAATACESVHETLINQWDAYDKAQAKRSMKVTYDDWWNGHNHDFVTCQQNVSAKYDAWTDMLDPNTESIAEAKKDLANARTNRIHVNLPASAQDALNSKAGTTRWKTEERFVFISPELKTFVDAGEDNFKKQTPEDTWKINKGTSMTNFTQEGWSGSGGFGGFVQLGGGASSSKFIKHTDDVTISFTFYKLDMVPVSAGDWYNKQFAELYACGPFKPGSKVDPDKLWSDDGLLSLRPSELLLAYKPRLTFHFDKDDYEEVWRRVSGSGGVTIGPFSIGGSAGRVDHKIEDHPETQDIVVTMNSNAAMVLAVLSETINPGVTNKSCAAQKAAANQQVTANFDH